MRITIENKTFDSVEQAVLELAFCHYPVRVSVGEKDEIFASFDDARVFVEKSAQN